MIKINKHSHKQIHWSPADDPLYRSRSKSTLK
jgi:hypothetical protein